VEARQKLSRRQPANLGQASRIDGVTPAEIAILQVHAQRLRKE
jgi:tRNA uridine 5-carboxymethylaminomethyl modification enzyme